MPGRSYSSGSLYRYGFNGKEKDSEVKGEGNSYDYGARIYDPRVCRWLAVDPKAKKYTNYSPYHFGFCNPIITIDPNGEENVVVVGGIDQHGDPMKFINSGLKQLSDYGKAQPKERTTLVLMTTHMSKYQIVFTKAYIQAMNNPNIDIVTVNSGQELANYMNSKNAGSNSLSDERKQDKITDMAFFGHGLINRGYDPGYPSPLGSDERERVNFSTDEIATLNPKAFDNAQITVYSCNSATSGNNNSNFSRELSKATAGTVSGWEQGLTDYGKIYKPANKDGLTKWDKILVALGLKDRKDDDLYDKQIRPADNAPTAGETKPDKVTYGNGIETKREPSK
ncbi:hypothetical protein BH10BAC2_BH10BAC2_33990 [soil metagenome]